MKSIAIVGIGCRFPGAYGPKDLWRLLQNGEDAISLLPPDRFSKSFLFANMSQDLKDRFYGGFLKNIDKFDANFFQISPREATDTDPQQRILLEVTWEALEDSGIIPETLRGSKTGVFIGGVPPEYGIRYCFNPHKVTPYTGTGSTTSILANRISYQYDLSGPSLVVDTACSSSLVALHLACESLTRGESTLALAGGVNMILSPIGQMTFGLARLMASDGRCKTFDARANGFVRSEGAGVIVLKNYDQALADGDHIYAIIRGSAINHDGRTNGIMAPSQWAQQRVIKEALADAAISPNDVQYVEAHGTGTLMGDPIEAEALGRVLCSERDSTHPLRVGSIKSNIGHMEAAAGIGGAIKLALALKHGVLPPSIHYQNPNPYIPFKELKLKVQSELTRWPTSTTGKRFAGISSFGFGGTNAHAVFEGVDNSSKTEGHRLTAEQPALFTLSAKSKTALREYARKYVEYFEENPSADLYSVSRTAACRRTHFEKRLAIVAKNVDDLKKSLENFSRQDSHLPEESSARYTGGPVFVFSGHGSQWNGMAKELISLEKVFKRRLEECDQAIFEETGWHLIEELIQPHPDFEGNVGRIQHILFSVAVALSDLWMSWGIKPAATVGHSMGEIAAAHITGILTLQDAVKIICRRSRLMASIKKDGAMAALELSADQARELIVPFGGQVSFAVSNSPKSTAVSGDKKAIQSIIEKLEKEGAFAKMVKIGVASHSAHMDSILQAVVAELEGIRPVKSKIPFYSSTLNKRVDGPELNPQYWAANMREPVYFYETVSKLIGEGFRLFIESSPHPILLSSIQETANFIERTKSPTQSGPVITCPSLRRNEPEKKCLLKNLGDVFMFGQRVDWPRVFENPSESAPLPTYPWQTQSYWLDDTLGFNSLAQKSQGLKGVEIRTANFHERRVWQVGLSQEELGYLSDHCLQQTPTFPGSAYIELANRAALKTFMTNKFVLKNTRLHKPLCFSPDLDVNLQITLSDINQSGAKFEIHSPILDKKDQLNDSIHWTLHSSGEIEVRNQEGHSTAFDANRTIASLPLAVESKTFYETLSINGNTYGETFRGVSRIWFGPSEALAEIEVPKALKADPKNYLLQPALLEACLQSGIGIKFFGSATGPRDTKKLEPESGYRLKSAEEINVHRTGLIPKWAHAKMDAHGRFNISIYDSEGGLVAEVKDAECEKFSLAEQKTQLKWPRRRGDWLYELKWRRTESPQPNKAQASTQSKDFWLIFADDSRVAKGFGDILSSRKVTHAIVARGALFKRVNENKWEINPMSADQYPAVLNHIKTMPDAVDLNLKIVHLWSLELAGEDCLDRSREPALTLLHLLKGLESCELMQKAKVWAITANAQGVDGGESKINVFQAPLWGVGRSLLEEHPDTFGGLIDLEHGKDYGPEMFKSLVSIIEESDETQLAFRNDQAFVPRLVRKKPYTTAPLRFRVRPDRTYLVTGGLGNLGTFAARWLIDKGARRLLVFGRTKLPPRDKWTSSSFDKTMESKILAVKSLERMGCAVEYRGLELSDEASISRALKEYKALVFPEIAGVIHTDGAVIAKAFSETTPGELEKVFVSKVDGTINLCSALKSEKLDFFVASSSLSSWMSSPYFSVYAGANAFVDALMRQRQIQGESGLAINWGSRDDNFNSDQAHSGLYRAIGTIPRSEVTKILEDLLSEKAQQAGIAVINWRYLKESSSRFVKTPFIKEIQIEDEPNVQNGPPAPITDQFDLTKEKLSAVDEPNRKKMIEGYLIRVIAKAVHRTPSEILKTQALNTFGLDSLIALEIKNAIARDTGVTVQVVSILKGITITGLAEKIAAALILANQIGGPAVSAKQTKVEIDVASLSEAQLDEILRNTMAGFASRDGGSGEAA